MKKDQIPLFEVPEKWEELWRGMPEYQQSDIRPFDSINVQFRNAEDRAAFLALLGESPDRRRSVWFPPMEIMHQSERGAPAFSVPPNRYPVYVISKGRWESRLTIKALEKLGIPHHVVIEPQEAHQYGAVIDAARILILPFRDLGQGSIPARNWVWEHALSSGSASHWILDDNIDGFYRLNRNEKVKVTRENPFIPMEELADRYSNCAISGLNYEFFADRRSLQPPFYLNTRVYSCILIRNDIPFRWRGRYNEDTDLCLRVLKAGLCTILMNAFLAKKLPSMKLKGGNTDELYASDGRLKMAESLRNQHPDVVTVTRKWGRWQHQVNYKPFAKNKLILKPGVVIPEGADEFGMTIQVRQDHVAEAEDLAKDSLP